MGKIAFALVFSLVLVLSIRSVLGEDSTVDSAMAQASQAASATKDAAGQAASATKDAAGQAASATKDAASHAASATKDATVQMSNSAEAAVKNAKDSSSSWTDWFKNKLGGMGNSGAPQAA